MASRIALVTGANGFVGCYVARALIARGTAVRALVRKGADLRALEGLPCELAWGDLRDAEAVEQATRGCEEVYHVAADYRLWVIDPAPMYAANVEGTRNVLTAAHRANVRRVIHTSTVGAIGIPHGESGREDSPVSLDDMVGHYKRSKFLAEQEALKAAREGVPVVIVNPSTPVGAYDFKPTPTGRIILDFLNRRMPAFMDTGLNLVDVEDTAMGHLLAAERGVVGEKYILGGENLTLQAMLGRLAKLSGMSAPAIRVPYAVAWTFALGAEAVARTITRRPPRASLTEVRMARKRMFFDSSKAREALGYTPRPIDDALARAIEFFRSTGAVRTASNVSAPASGLRRDRDSAMHLLFATIALRPYVFVFLACYLAIAIVNFGLRTTVLFTVLTFLVAWACEWSSVHNGFPFGLYHYVQATRGREIWVAGVPFMDPISFTFLSFASYTVALLLSAPLYRRGLTCARSTPGSSDVRRGYG